MARIRTIKPEFWASEQVMELSVAARLLFIGLWSFSDDRGVHAASPKRLKAEVFPSDDITSETIGGLMAELILHGLIGEFESDGQRYWYVTGWAKHQRIDRPTYRHPEPPNPATTPRALDESSPNDRRVLGGPSPREWNGREGNGEEGKEETGADAPATDGEEEVDGNNESQGEVTPSATVGIRELVAAGVNQQYAEDWLKVRKAKRMPLTRSAWESTVAEAGKAGITPAEVVRLCAERAWAGFRADYIRNANAPPGRPATQHTGFADFDYQKDAEKWNS